MLLTRRTAQLLHEDHRATMGMIEQLETLIAKAGRGVPDVGDPVTNSFLKRLASAIETEVRDHFAFEENELFTRLSAFGDAEIGQHLSDEHRAILPLGEQVTSLARASLASGFDQQSWHAFKVPAGELIERLLAHIQKEEMALLPMLDELLDAETDFALSESYGGTA